MRMNMMRIPCKDLSESENFYSNILGLEKIFGSIDDNYIGYQLDNVNLLIEPQEKGEFECGHFLGFSLEVDNIQSFYETHLLKGITFTGPPEKQFWGGIMTHIKDCNDNTFSIVQIKNV